MATIEESVESGSLCCLLRGAAVKISSLHLLLLIPSLTHAQWSQTSGPGVVGVNVVVQSGGDLLIGTDTEGVFRSTDNALSWSAANSGIEQTSIRSMDSSPAYVFAGVDFDHRGHGGVYRTPVDGTAWTAANSGIASQTILSLLVDGNTVYAGTAGAGVYKSTDNGDTWQQSNSGMGNESVGAIVLNAGTLFASGSNNLYRSDDGGATWVFTNGGQYFNIFSLAASGSHMYAGGFQGLIRSTDYGNTWSSRIDILILESVSHISGFVFQDSVVFAATAYGPGVGVIKSTDHGMTWSFANDGIEGVSLNSIVESSGNLVAGGSAKGVVVSGDGGASWTKSNFGLPPGGSIRDLLPYGSSIIAATGGDGVYQTTNNGDSWVNISEDPGNVLRDEIILALEEKGGVLFAGTAFSGLFRSSDGGLSWIESSDGLPSVTGVLALAVSGSNVIAGTGEGMFYSSDVGLTWLPTNIPDATVNGLAASDGFAYALVTGFTSTSGIYRSSNDGVSWSLVFPSGTTTLVGIAAFEQYVMTGSFSPGGIRSTDHGLTWLSYGIPDADGVYALLPTDTAVYAGTGVLSQGIYRSENFGASYSAFNEGFEQFTSAEALAVSNEQLFAGTNDRAVWRRFIGAPTSVNNHPEGNAAEYRLLQNYPNPFNAISNFEFSIEVAGEVVLRIYDTLGREVATLVDEQLSPGVYSRHWDAKGIASGIYMYRLQSTGFTASGKMVLIK